METVDKHCKFSILFIIQPIKPNVSKYGSMWKLMIHFEKLILIFLVSVLEFDQVNFLHKQLYYTAMIGSLFYCKQKHLLSLFRPNVILEAVWDYTITCKHISKLDFCRNLQIYNNNFPPYTSSLVQDPLKILWCCYCGTYTKKVQYFILQQKWGLSQSPCTKSSSDDLYWPRSNPGNYNYYK